METVDPSGVHWVMELEIPFGETQKLIRDIFLDVKGICDQLGLSYWLCYGTLLGAVVKGGFISPDSDIDIILPRSDYEVLKDRFNALCGDRCLLLSPEAEPDYYYSFVKVVDRRTVVREEAGGRGLPKIGRMGVYIDIFPLDGMPGGALRFRLHALRLRFLHDFRSFILSLGTGMFMGAGKPSVKTTGIGAAALKARICRKLALRFEAVSKKYDFGRSPFVVCDVGGRISRDVFRGSVPVVFEGMTLPAPAGYHEYLTRLYGDYMTTAPGEWHVPCHRFTAAWRHEG